MASQMLARYFTFAAIAKHQEENPRIDEVRLAMRDLINLRRLAPANNKLVVDYCHHHRQALKTMADETKNQMVKSLERNEKKEEEGDVPEKLQTPPPPPEKPLPGDCCGSGCARCVWDVYYEELEEYNKLYKK